MVSRGSAGSQGLEQTAVYQATSVAYRDMELFTAAITGTAAWEAILLRRPALVFGEFPYSALGQGFLHCPDLSSLPDIVPQLLALPPAEDHVLLRYLAALVEVSFDFPSDLFWGQVTAQRIRENPAVLDTLSQRLLAAMDKPTAAPMDQLAEAR